MKYLLYALVLSVCLYLAAFVTIYFLQEKLLFLPGKQELVIPSYLPITEYKIETADGVSISAWYMHVDSLAQNVLFFHGNGGNLGGRVARFEFFQTIGVNVLAIDYRGYGKSSGKIRNSNDLLLDAEAALDFYVHQKAASTDNVIVWGRSLGSVPATHLSSKYNVKAVVLESGFAELLPLAQKCIKMFPIKQLLKYKYRNIQKIKDIEAPILFVHGTEDIMIPYAHTEAMYAQAKPPRRLVLLPGGHNNLLSISGKQYMEVVDEFLDIFSR